MVWGVRAWSPKVIGSTTFRQTAYDFLVDFNRKYVYLVQFSSKTSYSSKVADFNLPHLHLAPP